MGLRPPSPGGISRGSAGYRSAKILSSKIQYQVLAVSARVDATCNYRESRTVYALSKPTVDGSISRQPAYLGNAALIYESSGLACRGRRWFIVAPSTAILSLQRKRHNHLPGI